MEIRIKAEKLAGKCLKRPTAISITVGLTVFFMAQGARAQDLDAFMDGPVTKLADKELAEQRGGLKLPNGLQVHFAVDITHKVNGVVTRQVQAVLDHVFDGRLPVTANVKTSKPQDPSSAVTNPADVVANIVTKTILPEIPGTSQTSNQSPAKGPDLSEEIPSVPDALPNPQSVTEAGDPLSDLALLQHALNGQAVVVNDLSNVQILDVTRVTVDIANYSSFAALAGQSQIGIQTLGLIRAQLAAGLGVF